MQNKLQNGANEGMSGDPSTSNNSLNIVKGNEALLLHSEYTEVSREP